jgi:hypothetical protein
MKQTGPVFPRLGSTLLSTKDCKKKTGFTISQHGYNSAVFQILTPYRWPADPATDRQALFFTPL